MLDANSPNTPLGQAIALFNQGHYYDCHDVLEEIWMGANPPDRPFYQGILQIAVGFYHLGNQNWQGATILLGEGVNRLQAFAPDYESIDVERLIDCGWSWLMTLQQTGRESVEPIARGLREAQSILLTSEKTHVSPAINLTVNDQAITLPAPYIYSPACITPLYEA